MVNSQRSLAAHDLADLNGVPRVQVLRRSQFVMVQRDAEDASQKGERRSGRDREAAKVHRSVPVGDFYDRGRASVSQRPMGMIHEEMALTLKGRTHGQV